MEKQIGEASTREKINFRSHPRSLAKMLLDGISLADKLTGAVWCVLGDPFWGQVR